jgi:drug/metabolite transporter (DMT)-like permease
MTKTNKPLVYVALIFSMLFWGASFILTKVAFTVLGPITTVLFRLLISAAFLWTACKLMGKMQKVEPKHYKTFLLLAFVEPFMYFIGENFGLTLVSSTVAAVLVATIPLFTPIAAYFFLKERFSFTNILGIMVSIVGVVMVLLKNDLSLVASPLGIAFMMFAVAAAIAYSMLISKFADKYNVYTIVTWQSTLGAIYFLPLFFIMEFKNLNINLITPQVFGAISGLAVFCSSFAFLLFAWGIQKIGISKANIFSNMIPVFTATIAYFTLGEKLSLLNVTGIVVVITGLTVSQLRISKEQILTFMSSDKHTPEM